METASNAHHEFKYVILITNFTFNFIASKIISNSPQSHFPCMYLTVIGELGRHVGRSIACSLLGPLEKGGQSKYEAFERTMHSPTVKFLGGVLTVISVEGLYSKNIVMSQHFASNLKVDVRLVCVFAYLPVCLLYAFLDFCMSIS